MAKIEARDGKAVENVGASSKDFRRICADVLVRMDLLQEGVQVAFDDLEVSARDIIHRPNQSTLVRELQSIIMCLSQLSSVEGAGSLRYHAQELSVRSLLATLPSETRGRLITSWLAGIRENTIKLAILYCPFDAAFYLEENRDVAVAGRDPLDHFEEYGWIERRNPSPWFDIDIYLNVNSDVAAAKVNPLKHFLEFGFAEGRSSCFVGSDRSGER